MRKSKLILLLLTMMISFPVFAQKQKEEIKITTSAQCDMCKESIEKMFAYEKGVISSELDLESKVVTVKYKSNRTDADKLRKALSKIGYDADDVKANPEIYEKLPDCCKKPEDR